MFHQVDVYAFGVMLNEMMAKQMPFAGMRVGEIRSKVSLMPVTVLLILISLSLLLASFTSLYVRVL